MVNILVLGSGGREHAIVWAFSQNPKCDRIFCAPGNAGIAEDAELVNLDIFDASEIHQFCDSNDIEFVMIGPEAPLAQGVADDLRSLGLLTFGPGRASAMLEASKAFTKDICAARDIPTAASESFANRNAALAYIKQVGAPIVVKADGLAAGKGVTVAETVAQANDAIDAIYADDAAAPVIIEEFMSGEEASLFILANGLEFVIAGTAQDHKRAFDGDSGPNTGGMGAYSPAPILTPEITDRAIAEIIRPTLEELNDRGMPFQGVLYAGLMIEDGQPRLVEYNVRFGDPEAQVLAMRLGAQLLDICLDCAKGKLGDSRVNWAEDHAITVVVAANGYPGPYTKGETILLPELSDPRLKIFHAGTSLDGPTLVSNGGRVLNVSARADTLSEARDIAYETAAKVNWTGGFYRNDIGWRAMGGTTAKS